MMLSKFDLTIFLTVKTVGSIDIITEVIGVQPTSQKNAAESYDKLNLWGYSKHYTGLQEISFCIQDFILSIPDFMTRASKVKALGECSIRLSFVSEFAQFGFALEPNELCIFKTLGIPVEVTVTSYGFCIDDR